MMKLIDDVAKIRLLENCPGWRGKVSVTRVSIREVVAVVVVLLVVLEVVIVVVVVEVVVVVVVVVVSAEGLPVSTQRLGVDRQHDNHDGGEEE